MEIDTAEFNKRIRDAIYKNTIPFVLLYFEALAKAADAGKV